MPRSLIFSMVSFTVTEVVSLLWPIESINFAGGHRWLFNDYPLIIIPL